MSFNFEEVFGLAIDQTMKEWKSFQLSVEHGMGGQYSNEKLVWMTQTIIEFFKVNKEFNVEDVEEYVTEIIDNEFDTVIEDGSLRIFAANVCKYFNLCASDRFQEVIDEIEAIKRNRVSVNNCLEQKDNQFVVETQMKSLNINGVNNSEDMNTDQTLEETEPESEGWTRVQRKNRK